MKSNNMFQQAMKNYMVMEHLQVLMDMAMMLMVMVLTLMVTGMVHHRQEVEEVEVAYQYAFRGDFLDIVIDVVDI